MSAATAISGGVWSLEPEPGAALGCEMRHVGALSDAERDVGRLLIEGLSCAEIAEHRGSSIHTIANQRRRVFSALQISGRYALIRRAAELGCFD